MKKAISLFLALIMCLSLCACGGTKAETEAPKTDTPTSVDTIDFTVDDGRLVYSGIEIPNSGLTSKTDLLLVEFEYTNLKSEPQHCDGDFNIQFFQNSVETDNIWSIEVSSSGGEQYDLYDNFSKQVISNTTIPVATFVKIKDNSPLTIVVSERAGQQDVFQQMEVDISSLIP